jgi:hypothetical protein
MTALALAHLDRVVCRQHGKSEGPVDSVEPAWPEPRVCPSDDALWGCGSVARSTRRMFRLRARWRSR